MSRSKWKFNYIGLDFQYALNLKKNNNNINMDIVVQNRATTISKEMVDLSVKVYNGIRYFTFFIEKDMVGHLLGEFSPSKKKALKKKKIKVKKK